VGLSNGTLEMEVTLSGPRPVAVAENSIELDPAAYQACPGKGIDYPRAYRALFGALPQNWLLGYYQALFIGHSRIPAIRSRAASGGVITQTLIYLLENGLIDGAAVLLQGQPEPWLAQPIIAQSPEEIAAASQSVYVPTPVNTILPEMAAFNGRLAYVGLPDQVASLRQLQRLGHRGAQKVDYVIGPYVGTSMYLEAIESFLRSNGVESIHEVVDLKYREGEWPGYLRIQTRSGSVLKVEKFYYNYLIPFYITRSSLLAVDFTNELTDISVGDAWHPRYERQGGGFSVIVARSTTGADVLATMEEDGLVALEEISLEDALSMHAHMIEFKKRGTFIRLEWRRMTGRHVPDYGYRPVSISFSRRIVELVIVTIFGICRTRLLRRLVEFIPICLMGPLFDGLRKAWKSISKPVKRRGLTDVPYEIVEELK
jgi:coenzyme F420 hydrogenase subunit beta